MKSALIRPLWKRYFKTIFRHKTSCAFENNRNDPFEVSPSKTSKNVVQAAAAKSWLEKTTSVLLIRNEY